jgi:hypothetical protein
VVYADENGNLHWVRVDESRAFSVSLLRTDYTLLAPIDLDADAHGNAYALTVSGPLARQTLSVCRLGNGLDVACNALPDAFIGNFPGVAGVALLPSLATFGVSDDGSIYTLGSDVASIQRYRFPDASTP